jgi:ribosomal protein S3
LTTFGIIGVKVWIYRGEILDPNASMARGTTTDPMKEVKVKDQGRGRGRDRGDRPRRDRNDR